MGDSYSWLVSTFRKENEGRGRISCFLGRVTLSTTFYVSATIVLATLVPGPFAPATLYIISAAPDRPGCPIGPYGGHNRNVIVSCPHCFHAHPWFVHSIYSFYLKHWMHFLASSRFCECSGLERQCWRSSSTLIKGQTMGMCVSIKAAKILGPPSLLWAARKTSDGVPAYIPFFYLLDASGSQDK